MQEAMVAIGNFNLSSSIRENPRAWIMPATLLASTQQRRNYSRRAEGGIDRRSKARAAAGEGKVCPVGAAPRDM